MYGRLVLLCRPGVAARTRMCISALVLGAFAPTI